MITRAVKKLSYYRIMSEIYKFRSLITKRLIKRGFE